jgi:hypothetical protein
MAVPDLDAPLTGPEFESLREVSKGFKRRANLPETHKNRLLELELIRDALGGLTLTEAGEIRLARGH